MHIKKLDSLFNWFNKKFSWIFFIFHLPHGISSFLTFTFYRIFLTIFVFFLWASRFSRFTNMAVTVDQLNPFSLHHPDKASKILATHPLTANGENYVSRKCDMIWALSSKNKYCLVNGSSVPPPEGDPQFPLWLRCNNNVASWTLNSIYKELAVSVMYSSMTRDI